MDPAWTIARRDVTAPFIAYDERFMYSNGNYQPGLGISRDRKDELHVNKELLDMFVDVKSKVRIPESEAILYERAHPLLQVSEWIEGDPDALALHWIFGIPKSTVIVRSDQPFLTQVLQELSKEAANRKHLVVMVDNMTSSLEADALYLLSLHYTKITLIQPAISANRYAVCLNVKEFGAQASLPMSEMLETIKSENVKKPSLTRLFDHLPQAYLAWLYEINNLNIGINIEIQINLLAVKTAYDKGKHYWPDVSYDRAKLLSVLHGGPLMQTVIQSKLIERRDEPDPALIRPGIHLRGDNPSFAGQPLHITIDVNKDERLPYVSRRAELKAGDHHGQRKLLLSEMEFFNNYLDKDVPTIVIYIGASPFSHGTLLMRWFPNVMFWLVDPRIDEFNDEIRSYGEQGRLMITGAFYTEEFARALVGLQHQNKSFEEAFPSLYDKTYYRNTYDRFRPKAKKFFFWSDIRSANPSTLGNAAHEARIDADMRLQTFELLSIENAVGSENFLAMFKFRLPYGGAPNYHYMKGTIYTQVWPRLTSTELRLVGKPSNGEDVYDKKAIEDIMFYHNSVLRNRSFGPLPIEIEGYCTCHDCHREVGIIIDFVDKFRTGFLGTRTGDDEAAEIANDINGFLKTTLEEHVDRTYNRIISFNRQLTRDGKERFNPSNEVIRSTKFHAIEAKFIELAKELMTKKADLTVLKTIHREFVVYSMWTRQNTDSILDRGDLADVLFTSELADVPLAAKALSEIIAHNGKKAPTESELTTKLLQPWFAEIAKILSSMKRLMQRDNDRAPAFVHGTLNSKMKSVEFTAQTGGRDRPFTTKPMNEKVMRRFMVPQERFVDMPDWKLASQPEINARAFCILQRYGNVWLDHMAHSPVGLYELHPDFPGVECGFSLLSTAESRSADSALTAYNEAFCTSQPDYELVYANVVSPFSKLFVVEYFDAKLVTIFPPNIPPLLSLFVEAWVRILGGKEAADANMTLVFVYPEGSPACDVLRRDSHFQPDMEIDLPGNKVFDSRLGTEVVLTGKDKRKVLVLKTRTSKFELRR